MAKKKQQKSSYALNVRFDPELYKRFKAAAKIQEHSQGQLVRILVEWSLPFYEKLRSVELLEQFSVLEANYGILQAKRINDKENKVAAAAD